MDRHELDSLRDQIDSLDEKIVGLLCDRAACVKLIGRYKQEHGMGVYEANREAAVLANVVRCNRGPLPDEELTSIYTSILAAMRRMQSADILERP